MSVDVELYVGYTITLKERLTHEDFKFFGDFTEEHTEYDEYNRNSKSKVKLIEDGMSGNYARLIYIDKRLYQEDFYSSENFFALENSDDFEEKYAELNKAYKLMYNKELDKEQVKYAVWFHVS